MKSYFLMHVLYVKVVIVCHVVRTASVRTILDPGELVYGKVFQLQCLATVDSSNIRYAVFHRSRNADDVGRRAAIVQYSVGLRECFGSMDSTLYNKSCSENGSVLSLVFPPENEAEHDTWWRCTTISHSVPQQIEPVHVYIIVPVHDITLLVNGAPASSVIIKQGQSWKLKCVTALARPPANITWFDGVKDVTARARTTTDTIGTKYLTESELVLNETSELGGKYYSCSASNFHNHTVDSTRVEIKTEENKNNSGDTTEGNKVWVPIVVTFIIIIIIAQAIVIAYFFRRRWLAKRNAIPPTLPRLSHLVDPHKVRHSSAVSNHMYDRISVISGGKLKTGPSFEFHNEVFEKMDAIGEDAEPHYATPEVPDRAYTVLGKFRTEPPRRGEPSVAYLVPTESIKRKQATANVTQ